MKIITNNLLIILSNHFNFMKKKIVLKTLNMQTCFIFWENLIEELFQMTMLLIY